MKKLLKKAPFLISMIFVLALIILPSSINAAGTCSCEFLATGSYVSGEIGGCPGIDIGASCYWSEVDGGCICQANLTGVDSGDCSTNVKTTISNQGYSSIMSYSISGSCAFSEDITTDAPTTGTPPTPTTPVPDKVELQPPFGQQGQSGDVFIQEIVGVLINWLLGIVGSIALLMFVIGGFVWLTSAGNPDRIKTGKNILVWSVLGLVVIFASYAITRVILEAILG